MHCLLLETAGLQSEPDRRSTYAFCALRSSIDVCKQILTIQAMLWRNSQQNFQVYSLKTICGYLTLLGKLNLFQNLFIQGKVGVANGKVGVGYDGRRLILKTLDNNHVLWLVKKEVMWHLFVCCVSHLSSIKKVDFSINKYLILSIANIHTLFWNIYDYI